MKSFSKSDRSQNLLRLKTEEFDLLIIGGGITGAGIARDAASRGMKVALVEAQDFSEGTSSRSSKLIHGGIRYLENYEFHLVFEALAERKRLFSMAPHLVHPLRFMLPVYKDSRVGMNLMSLGMWLYDLLALMDVPKMHEKLGALDTLIRMPMLRGRSLLGSFVYSDAYMDDDRLVIETLRSANDQEACSVNFVKAMNAVKDSEGKLTSMDVCDGITDEKFNIKAKHFISAVGPWTDYLGESFFSDWTKKMRPSKGVHLTFAKERIPLSSAVVMATGDDERIVFAIPRNDMVILGTTDTDFSGDPNDVATTQEDVDYILAVAQQYFPGAGLTKKDIIASYSGVRPLIADGSDEESKTSREHKIIADPRNLTIISGGKYTTYRKMAEDTVETALKSFPIEDRANFHLNSTKTELNPQVTKSKIDRIHLDKIWWAEKLKLSVEDIDFLIERHGSEVMQFKKWTNKVTIKNSKNNKWLYEVYHAIENTMCMRLIDFYIRRTPLMLGMPDHGFSMLDEISEIFASAYNWDEAEVSRQKRLLKSHIQKEMPWKSL